MIETGIAITAGTHLALAMDEIGYTDLDGQLFLEKDIIKGGVVYRNGRNSLSPGPGLGVTVGRFPR
jgi:L-alanine-DL-glutamate epimerase-like enolase superfamily enzyme